MTNSQATSHDGSDEEDNGGMSSYATCLPNGESSPEPYASIYCQQFDDAKNLADFLEMIVKRMRQMDDECIKRDTK